MFNDTVDGYEDVSIMVFSHIHMLLAPGACAALVDEVTAV
jgi:hypothetical protein